MNRPEYTLFPTLPPLSATSHSSADLRNIAPRSPFHPSRHRAVSRSPSRSFHGYPLARWIAYPQYLYRTGVQTTSCGAALSTIPSVPEAAFAVQQTTIKEPEHPRIEYQPAACGPTRCIFRQTGSPAFEWVFPRHVLS